MLFGIVIIWTLIFVVLMGIWGMAEFVLRNLPSKKRSFHYSPVSLTEHTTEEEENLPILEAKEKKDQPAVQAKKASFALSSESDDEEQEDISKFQYFQLNNDALEDTIKNRQTLPKLPLLTTELKFLIQDTTTQTNTDPQNTSFLSLSRIYVNHHDDVERDAMFGDKDNPSMKELLIAFVNNAKNLELQKKDLEAEVDEKEEDTETTIHNLSEKFQSLVYGEEDKKQALIQWIADIAVCRLKIGTFNDKFVYFIDVCRVAHTFEDDITLAKLIAGTITKSIWESVTKSPRRKRLIQNWLDLHGTKMQSTMMQYLARYEKIVKTFKIIRKL